MALYAHIQVVVIRGPHTRTVTNMQNIEYELLHFSPLSVLEDKALREAERLDWIGIHTRVYLTR